MNSRELNFLADLIDAKRLAWPPEARQLRSVGVFGDQDECWRLLAGVSGTGAPPVAAAWLLRRLADERVGREALEASVQAVVSGPCLLPGLRNTEDVFREIIDRANSKILITGFALHGGQTVLAHLAQRMDQHPDLNVVLCLDISRDSGNTSDGQAIISGFANRFRHMEWPGRRLPKLFYDPRSLARGADERSVLHAKVAVADSSCALIGSANLTEAALKRNIEIGVLIALPALVALVRSHVEALIHNQVLVQVPL
jgi:phosphatidylserine/phosphatidylglycerophosphate/cardiolipin synthase-like enzyme